MKSTAKSKRPKITKLKIFEKKKPRITTPIKSAVLSIREMKSSDKHNVSLLINEAKHEYYVHVYRHIFRSWFSYGLITLLLGVSLTLVQSSMPSVCLPPFLITLFLIWKVKRYKRANRTYTSTDLELMNMNETDNFRFKNSDQRRAAQGVYLMFYKKGESMEDYDFLDSDLDLSTSESEDETKVPSKGLKKEDDEKNKILVGYLVYGKERDVFDTVQIKEIVITSDYRHRKVASNFIQRMCNNVFRTYGYTRVSFTISNFHFDVNKILAKKEKLVKKIQSWPAWSLLPGVTDERTIYTFLIKDLNEKMKLTE